MKEKTEEMKNLTPALLLKQGKLSEDDYLIAIKDLLYPGAFTKDRAYRIRLMTEDDIAIEDDRGFPCYCWLGYWIKKFRLPTEDEAGK